MAIVFKEYTEEEKERLITRPHLGCIDCVYFPDEFEKECDNSPCTSVKREDKKNGYFIEIPD